MYADKSKKVYEGGNENFYDEKEDDTINKSIKRQFLYQSAKTTPFIHICFPFSFPPALF